MPWTLRLSVSEMPVTFSRWTSWPCSIRMKANFSEHFDQICDSIVSPGAVLNRHRGRAHDQAADAERVLAGTS
jgi:hypothetical protein